MEQQYQYTQADLEKRLEIISEKDEKIRKCLEYALERFRECHNQAGRGLIVDDALYDINAKFETLIKEYNSYNQRLTKKIRAKLEDMKPVEAERSSSVPRRSV